MDIHYHIYLVTNDTAHTIALYSTVKCDDGAHLSFIGRLLGIYANGYPFSHIPTNKWYIPYHRFESTQYYTSNIHMEPNSFL